MRYCNRRKCACTCGKLVTYDRKGHVRESQGDSACLTDSEIRSALAALLQEWRRRCVETELSAPATGCH